MSDKDVLSPSTVLCEPEDFPPFPNPDLSFQETNACLLLAKKQRDEMNVLQRKIHQSEEKRQKGVLFLGKFDSFLEKWISLLEEISSDASKKNTKPRSTRFLSSTPPL